MKYNNPELAGIGERIKNLRLDKKLSQAQLAKAAGLSQHAIMCWETEKRLPKARSLIILAKFFNVRANYILGLDDKLR